MVDQRKVNKNLIEQKDIGLDNSDSVVRQSPDLISNQIL